MVKLNSINLNSITFFFNSLLIYIKYLILVKYLRKWKTIKLQVDYLVNVLNINNKFIKLYMLSFFCTKYLNFNE